MLKNRAALASELPSVNSIRSSFPPRQAAYDEIEEEEDEHLYHTKGWCRELWLKSLGLKSVIPPPEEKKNVKSAAAAEQAKNQR